MSGGVKAGLSGTKGGEWRTRSSCDTVGRMTVIARSWMGHCPSVEAADRYARHLADAVLPELNATDGHLGALLLRRGDERGVKVHVVTFWSSLEAIDRFAGPDRERAVVEPAARAVLDSFADEVEHFDVVIDTRGEP
jgi:heme-degrading monooxygenase HmoA